MLTAQHLQWQRDMGKKLALTLKVLQLQKEHADKDQIRDATGEGRNKGAKAARLLWR